MKVKPIGERSDTNILLFEGNTEDALAVVRSLGAVGVGIQTDHVQNKLDFKRRVSTGKYDIILCNCSLPGWNGLEAVRWVRQSGYDTPFVYLCDANQDDVTAAGLQNQVCACIRKSDLSHLSHALRRVLDEQVPRGRYRPFKHEDQGAEGQYRLLFEMTPEPMWVCDRATDAFLAISDAAIAQYGYSRDEFLTMRVGDIRSNESVFPGLQRTLQRQCKTPEAETSVHRKKDGTLIAVNIYRTEVQFNGVEATLVLVHDVSDVLKNERRLRQLEERFSVAFRACPIPIAITTKVEGRYVDVNEACVRMLGCKREQVIGHTSLELNVWENPEDRARLVEHLVQNGAVSSFDTVITSKSLGRRSVRISAEIIQLDDTPCVLSVTHDLTEAKAMELHLRQAQKMEALGRLAGGIAHDFKNMLGVIIGHCDLAEDHADCDLIQRHVVHIKKAARHATNLTNQLLVFSRQHASQPSVLDLNVVVGDMIQTFLRVIATDIDLQFVPGALGNIRADLGQIEQILLNLVINACDAMPDGGKIVIKTSDLDLDKSSPRPHPEIRPGAYVVLSISDSGCGMSEATMSNIFEPFFTTKSPGEGTGLGLSIVYGAMQQAKGHIGVSSRENHGTIFNLYFPRVDESADSQPRSADEFDLKGGSETILVVENDVSMRETTAELLRKEGYSVLEAANGPAAIQLSANWVGSIHLLLANAVMPGMNGCQLASHICASRAETKVVYMSGHAGTSIIHKYGLQLGVAILQKPFTRRALLCKLRVSLDTDSSGDRLAPKFRLDDTDERATRA